MASQEEERAIEVIKELWEILPETVQSKTEGGINVNEHPYFNKRSKEDQKKFSKIIDTILLDLNKGVALIDDENGLSKQIIESTTSEQEVSLKNHMLCEKMKRIFSSKNTEKAHIQKMNEVVTVGALGSFEKTCNIATLPRLILRDSYLKEKSLNHTRNDIELNSTLRNIANREITNSIEVSDMALRIKNLEFQSHMLAKKAVEENNKICVIFNLRKNNINDKDALFHTLKADSFGYSGAIKELKFFSARDTSPAKIQLQGNVQVAEYIREFSKWTNKRPLSGLARFKLRIEPYVDEVFALQKGQSESFSNLVVNKFLNLTSNRSEPNNGGIRKFRLTMKNSSHPNCDEVFNELLVSPDQPSVPVYSYWLTFKPGEEPNIAETSFINVREIIRRSYVDRTATYRGLH